MNMEKMNQILLQVKKVIIGKDEILKKVLLSIMARGHILIEDIPGVGKTTLALAFSKAMDLQCKRLQFTPDVLPSDITGFSIFDKNVNDFVYKPGVAMCNLFLADEINRTSSKTQSALLEIMEEGNITVDGITRQLPEPYIVIATQNPIGSIGTHMLPESQLDRFMIRITMGYPDIKSEIEILKSKQGKLPLNEIEKVVDFKEIVKIQNSVEKVYINDISYEYIARLVLATRENPLIQLGVSPRGTLALVNMSKANAYFNGRMYVIPEDIMEVFKDVVQHRIILNQRLQNNDITVEKVIDNIITTVKLPKIIGEKR
ncbi:MAG: MoxR family ATPase [Clostridium sp.]|nr:MoxR family ATPase [Clostridium sp.]MDY3827178.1 MoxR family ATPase [Clostridium sp.]